MNQEDADLFFLSPRTRISAPNRFSVLYLLRRDIDLCMGVDPDTERDVTLSYRALWPGAMAMLAGVDLLAKFLAGSDDGREVGKRFRRFLECFFDVTKPEDRKAIYQLRNSLLHSFGLYAQDQKGNVYRFFLTDNGTGPLVSHKPPDQYYVDLRVLHREFERAVKLYQDKLNGDGKLQENFTKMFGNYGCVYIG
jgi:hypothetical protein